MSDLLAQVADLWERNHWPNPGGLKLLGLRACAVIDGAVVANAGRYDHFDDALILFDESQGVIDHVACTASQPGDYWDKHQELCPWLRPGAALFARGIHRGEYPCLVQAGDVRGTVAMIRDANKDGVWDYDSHGPDKFDYCLNTGIHIHHAGREGQPSVGIWSAGCTVVQDGDGPLWGVVKDYVWGKYGEQPNFFYGIAPAAWLTDGGKRLLWGSVDKGNREVSQLQEFLNEHDASALTVNGKFDQATDVAYRGHQRYGGVKGDGICVNAEWLVPAPEYPRGAVAGGPAMGG